MTADSHNHILDMALEQADQGNFANLELYVRTIHVLEAARVNTCVVERFNRETLEVTEYHRSINEIEPHWWRVVRPAFSN